MGAYTRLHVLLSLITLATTLWKNQHRRVFVYISNSIMYLSSDVHRQSSQVDRRTCSTFSLHTCWLFIALGALHLQVINHSRHRNPLLCLFI